MSNVSYIFDQSGYRDVLLYKEHGKVKGVQKIDLIMIRGITLIMKFRN